MTDAIIPGTATGAVTQAVEASTAAKCATTDEATQVASSGIMTEGVHGTPEESLVNFNEPRTAKEPPETDGPSTSATAVSGGTWALTWCRL